MKDNLKIPYGVSNFTTIRTEHLYYVDKTGYIPPLEQAGRFLFFVRPRRFGKSLMADMLRCYYDIAEKDNFDKLFAGLEIAKNPTGNRNRYLVLALDFSCIVSSPNTTLQQRFEEYLGVCLDVFAMKYESEYGPGFADSLKGMSTQAKFSKISETAKAKRLPLYLFLDEYDNFTNQMLRSEGGGPYRDVTHGQGFYRSWFKLFKAAFDRIYMTGVSPVTMDDLTSGFNIAANISQNPRFNAMLGFSESEVLQLYEDFKGVGEYRNGEPADWVRSIKPWYDGYCFSPRKVGVESVFNSDMVLYHLSAMVDSGEPPEDMVDKNIKTDYDKLQTIADIQHLQYRQRNGGDPEGDSGEDVLPLTEQLAATGMIAFDLVESFPADEIAAEANFRSLFHYYGILSMAGREKGRTVFKIPNVCVERQLFEYLRKAYRRTRTPSWLAWGKLASALAYDGEWRPFLERLASDLKDTQPVRGAIDREIRVQGYMQCEFGHINFYLARPEMELNRGFCDFCLFPERIHFGDVRHSYIIELKHAAPDASRATLDAQYRDALEKLSRYRADRSVPSLARGTVLHQVVFQFKGDDMIRCEQIAEERM